jgi:GntR family transcriptional regulator, transcriptional repressor for pyruvate dehydrogenase complex
VPIKREPPKPSLRTLEPAFTSQDSELPRDSTSRVVDYVRDMVMRGVLRPGDRLPAERELAVQLGVSRPTVRAGLKGLSAMGAVVTRHGAGTFISESPVMRSEPLNLLAALHGFTRDDMYETRRMLEVAAAGLAAERATPAHISTIADEVTNLFASMEDRRTFLFYDIRFHRAVANASGNPLVASLVEMISALYYDQRQKTAERATGTNLRDAAEAHRRVYLAIRARDPERARAAMNDHLMQSSAYQEAEERGDAAPAASPSGSTDDRPAPRRPTP